ncbi:hypothetical protein B0J13DRAFT_116071 [Dactylonectria estremocensis]|uniref:Uncharacterized protein n=1 Tax=Dactylonectria estremocensis TaxID=1079267 RepID=A0A9P9FCM4_9HYPO|nr:hypothetical protein B0J13DRAFT_116071 [Dactylonectria estremocensis]
MASLHDLSISNKVWRSRWYGELRDALSLSFGWLQGKKTHEQTPGRRALARGWLDRTYMTAMMTTIWATQSCPWLAVFDQLGTNHPLKRGLVVCTYAGGAQYLEHPRILLSPAYANLLRSIPDMCQTSANRRRRSRSRSSTALGCKRLTTYIITLSIRCYHEQRIRGDQNRNQNRNRSKESRSRRPLWNINTAGRILIRADSG